MSGMQSKTSIGNIGGGVDTNQMVLLTPVVTLGATNSNLEWVGTSTFDFTAYVECYFVARGQIDPSIGFWNGYAVLDGVVTGYDWNAIQLLDIGLSGNEGNADTKIDFKAGNFNGRGTSIVILAKFGRMQPLENYNIESKFYMKTVVL